MSELGNNAGKFIDMRYNKANKEFELASKALDKISTAEPQSTDIASFKREQEKIDGQLQIATETFNLTKNNLDYWNRILNSHSNIQNPIKESNQTLTPETKKKNIQDVSKDTAKNVR